MTAVGQLLAPPEAPAVAAGVAARLLRAFGSPVTTGPGRITVSDVDCELSWAGPVRLPLESEDDVQAACGISHVHGRRYGRPTALAVDYASVAAGVLAAQGVLAALLAGTRGLPVRRVSTSVAQAALLSLAQYLAAATAGDEPGAPGGPPFASADGVRFEIETLVADGWRRFWAGLGADPAAVRDGWRPFQHRFATATCPLPDELHRATRAVDLSVLAAAAGRAGVSLVPVAGPGARPAADLPAWRLTPVPGSAAPRPPALADALPLDGLVVVEACRRVQGPLAGHLLHLLGATVIRVEPPGGDPLRGVPPVVGDWSARFVALNRGKRAVEADLTTASGRRAVHELVAGADVFLQNWAPGKAETFALDAGRLAATRPGLVYAWASGWGDRLGPRPPLGTDYLVQAHSGLAASAGPDPVRPSPSLMTLTDVLGGLVSATGVVAGLLTVARTGVAQRVDSSLLSAAVLCRDAPRTVRTGPRVEVRTDLAELAADHRFAGALDRDGCCLVRSPWEFGR